MRDNFRDDYGRRMGIATAAWVAIGTILFGVPVAYVHHSLLAATTVALVALVSLGWIAGAAV